MVIPSVTTEYVHIPITATPAGADITDSQPRIAFLLTGARDVPHETDWLDAEWVDGTTARILIGPDGGATSLTAGSYQVWIAFDPDGPEHIVRPTGRLAVT